MRKMKIQMMLLKGFILMVLSMSITVVSADECPYLSLPRDLDNIRNINEICHLSIGARVLTKDELIHFINNRKKYLDIIKQLENLKRLSIHIWSPRAEDSTFYSEVFNYIPNPDKIENISLGYSGPFPENIPELPGVKEIFLWNNYEHNRYKPFKNPESYSSLRMIPYEDSVAIVDFAKSFSPPPFPQGLFRAAKNTEVIKMYLSREDTLLPNDLFDDLEHLDFLDILTNRLKELPLSLSKAKNLSWLSLADCYLTSFFPDNWEQYPDSLQYLDLGWEDLKPYYYFDNETVSKYTQPCKYLEDFPFNMKHKTPNLKWLLISLPKVKNLESGLRYLPTGEIISLIFDKMESLVSLGDNICINEREDSFNLSIRGAPNLENISGIKSCNVERLILSNISVDLLWGNLTEVIPKSGIKELYLDYGSIRHLSPEDFEPLKPLKNITINRKTSIAYLSDNYIEAFDNIDKDWIEGLKSVLPDTEIRIQ